MRRVFVTGGSGFIGFRLITALVRHGYTIIALDRSGRLGERAGALPIEVVQGDLLEPDTYRTALESADVVLHLGASTGRASAEEHHRTNAAGTETLMAACVAARVQRFVFVSTIAVTFADLDGYPYAQAKVLAERVVGSSTIPHVILRPTMVLGPGSPILAALSTLATLPVLPVFGSGRTAVQPVSVDDVVACILQVLASDRFSGETLEIGGPEAVPIEELLQTIRVAKIGRRGRVFRIPLGLVLPLLKAADALGVGRLLPITVGQLATFRFPGIARSDGVGDGRPLVGLRSMVASRSEADAISEPLAAECRTFTGYLLAIAPTPYVLDRYVRAHRALELTPADAFDQRLVRIATRHRLLTRLADSYSRVFAPASLLRRKLVLLLAILETSPPAFRAIDSPVRGTRFILAGALAIKGLLWLIGLCAAIAVFLPLQMATAHRKSS